MEASFTRGDRKKSNLETSFLQDAVLVFSGSNFVNDREKLDLCFPQNWNTIKCCFASEILQVSNEIASCKALAGIEPHLEKFSSVDITERKMWPTWKEVLKDHGFVLDALDVVFPSPVHT